MRGIAFSLLLIWSSCPLLSQIPTINTQPINANVNVGGNVIFSINATGTITAYQWQVSSNGGSSYTDITAAGTNPIYAGWTTNTLTLSGISIAENGMMYRCQVFGATSATTETFNTAGSGTWICPAGVTNVTIQCWGAGGAGGSCPAGSNIQNCSGGGGGGAFSSSILSVAPGTSYPYSIGAGGVPTGTNGNPGGNTTFNNNAIVAMGGQGGGWRAPDGYNPGGPGAAGGASTSGIGSLRYSGGNGNAGSIGYCGGGAGGGAGTLGNGGTAPGGINWTGGSGTALGGGNGGHGGSWADRGTYTGANGNSIGGGGGGSSNYGWSPNATYGGYGANGAIKILYNASSVISSSAGVLSVTAPPTITTFASPSIINCGDSTTLTASSTSAAQPCIKADLPATLQNGLVGYWPFCGNANDASGNNNNGTVNGATLTTDRFGNANSAYSFNGFSSKIEVSDANTIDFTNNYTLSAWYNTNSTSQFDQAILGKGGTTDGTGYQLLVNSNTSPVSLQFGFNNSVGLNGGSSTPVNANNLNGWHLLTGTYDGSVARLFLDGILMTSVNVFFSLPNSTRPLLFGNETNSLIRYFNGKLDDIAIYNRALSASEVQQLYNLGNVSYSWSTGATTPSITVSPAQTTSYLVTATNSAGSTTSSVTVTVADSLSWTGLFDTDWHKPCNWSPQFVPKCCNNVVIPLTSNQPIVSGVAAAGDLTIYTTNGAQLAVNNGANLQIADCPITITTAACPSLAVLTTTAVSGVTQTSAVSGGTISYQGASAITARGICWSTSQNPTIANSFTTNGTGVGTFTSNLTGLTAGTTYYVRAYATNASGTSYGNEVSFVAVNPQPAYPANSIFCASGPTLVIDVTNPATGKTWMDRNLGATQVATSSTDANAYGDLYQWGRGSDGHQCRNSATTTTLSSTDQPGNGNFITINSGNYDWRSPQNVNLWQGVNGVNNPCPIGYRLPTETELEAERLSWNVNTSVGAFVSPLKLPLAGFRWYNSGMLSGAGTDGFYWGSTASGIYSRALSFASVGANMATEIRAVGRAVRCIKN